LINSNSNTMNTLSQYSLGAVKAAVSAGKVSGALLTTGYETMKPHGSKILSVAKENAPKVAACIQSEPALKIAAGVGVGGALLLAAPAVVSAPFVLALNSVGFSAGGVGAGSIAAASQAAIGNVAAPSAFAFLTSTAMGGYGLAAVNGAVQVAGGVMMAGAGPAAWIKSKL